MDKKFRAILDKTPPIIDPLIKMNSPNESIKIHEGRYTIRSESNIYELNGLIEFRWLPSIRVVFKGEISSNNSLKDGLSLIQEKPLSIFIDDNEIGKGIIIGTNVFEVLSIKGIIYTKVIVGDNSVNVSKINFEISNLRDFIGATVKSGNKLSNNRLVLSNNKYEILVDKLTDYPNRVEKLKESGGYLFLYTGVIIPKKKSLSYKEGINVIFCLGKFLTFLNGRNCNPIFIRGIFNGQPKWIEYTPNNSDQYKNVINWPCAHNVSGLSELWESFFNLWQDKNERNLLETVLHWYIQSNNQSGAVEGSIVMIQNALELLYNWLIIEKKQIIKGEEALNLSASNKIRLLLNQSKIPTDIPLALANIRSYLSSNTSLFDGPDVIVQIRNAIVHSTKDKRIKLSKINFEVRNEALKLSLWYVELLLLYVLEYNGMYYNRCAGAEWTGEGEENVPWKV